MYFIGGGGGGGGHSDCLGGVSPTYFTLNTRMLSQKYMFLFYPRLHRFPKKQQQNVAS